MATLGMAKHFDLLVFRLGIFQMLTLSLKNVPKARVYWSDNV